jgi:polyhydroxybutyrate depolymerase
MHEWHGTATTGVLLFGYSNGAQMAFRLAFEKPELVGGYAVVGANLPVPENMLCDTEGPTAKAMVFAGTEDGLVPFDGGESTIFGLASRGMVTSSYETLAALAKRNGLKDPPVEADLPSTGDGTRVRSRTWSRDGAPYLVHYVIEGGGHTIPQQAFRAPRVLGRTTRAIDAPREVVRFFLGPAK